MNQGNEAKNSIPQQLEIGKTDTDREPQEAFTPGPWEIVDRRKAPLPNVIIVGADGSTVACVEGVHMRDPMLRSSRSDDRGRWTPEDAEAADSRALRNAHLIVAAPALYEVIAKHAKELEWALGFNENGSLSPHGVAYVITAQRELAAALALATTADLS